MNSIPPHHPEHRYEEISLLAYHLWQQAHCPPGEDLKFWLQAEEQLFGKRAPQSSAKTKTAAAPKPAAKPAARSAPAPAAKARAKSMSKAAKPQPRAR